MHLELWTIQHLVQNENAETNQVILNECNEKITTTTKFTYGNIDSIFFYLQRNFILAILFKGSLKTATATTTKRIQRRQQQHTQHTHTKEKQKKSTPIIISIFFIAIFLAVYLPRNRSIRYFFVIRY